MIAADYRSGALCNRACKHNGFNGASAAKFYAQVVLIQR